MWCWYCDGTGIIENDHYNSDCDVKNCKPCSGTGNIKHEYIKLYKNKNIINAGFCGSKKEYDNANKIFIYLGNEDLTLKDLKRFRKGKLSHCKCIKDDGKLK